MLSVDLVCCWNASCVQGFVGVSLLLESTTSFRKEGGIDCVVRKMVTREEFVVAIALRDDL